MSNMTLPMQIPFISCYPYHANLFSVILNNRTSLPWIFNNYVLLESPKKNDIGMRIDFYSSLLWKTCPWIYYQRISRELVNLKWKLVTDFVIKSISLGYYVYFNVDTFFISSYDSYQKHHAIHDIFVFGYDDQKQMFNVADNFRSGVYSHDEISFKELIEGYSNINKTKGGRLDGEIDWLNGIELISYRDKYGYNFDIDLLKCDLHDYLHSQNSRKIGWARSDQFWKNECIYGIGIYDILVNYLENNIRKNEQYDMRPFHVLWEHKKMMVLRLEFLLDQNYIIESSGLVEEYKHIEELSLIIRNLWIKSSITKNGKILNDILYKLDELRKLEFTCIQRIIENL